MKQIIEILIACGVIFIGIGVDLGLLVFIGSSLEDFFNKK